MAKQFDTTKITKVTITNKYDPAKDDIDSLALSRLTSVSESEVFNTGASALGDPHIDSKYVEANVGKAVIMDCELWKAKHIVAFPIYRTNSYVYLKPGDSIVLAVPDKYKNSAVYYKGLESEFVEVTFDANPYTGEDASEEEDCKKAFLSRDTGIGDNDGNPINFDSKEVTTVMKEGLVISKCIIEGASSPQAKENDELTAKLQYNTGKEVTDTKGATYSWYHKDNAGSPVGSDATYTVKSTDKNKDLCCKVTINKEEFVAEVHVANE